MKTLPLVALCAVSVWVLSALAVPVIGAEPNLGIVTPRGGQRGTELDLLLNGARLSDAQQILFYSPGFEVTSLEVVNDNQVKAHVKLAADCRLGEHSVRVRTATGISELRTFFVGPFPSVDEKEPNDDFKLPQRVDMNYTVAGVADNEDVDYYVVTAKKGQRINAEVEGMRLGVTVFDPYVAILDAKRFELDAADDTPLVWQDAAVGVVAPEDGDYVVMVRESSYAGNGSCMYRLHVGDFPRPKAIYPAGGKLGTVVPVKFLGDAAGDFTQDVQLPAEQTANFGIPAQDASGMVPSLHAFRLSTEDNVLEVEPNNAQQEATSAVIPSAMNGIIEKPGDVDQFKFTAKQGQVWDVHCYARRIRTPLDGLMYIDLVGGGTVAGSDDAVGPDSYFRFTVPQDGEYVLRMTDHLGKGGPDYVYRVEFKPVAPSLAISIPKVSLFSQERQTVSVPKGNRYATIVAASRADFGGDLVIQADQLPPGVTVSAENMPAGLTIIPVLFEAAPESANAATFTNLGAAHIDPATGISGGFTQDVELSTGGPGQSVYWRNMVDRLAVAVTDEAPFKISIVEPKVPLVQNGSMELKVVAERKEGFTAPIALQMLFNPPGVGSSPGVTIPEGQTEITYPLNAAGNAELRDWKICILGTATVGNGPVRVSTQLAKLTVAAPFVTLALQRGASEQGKDVDMFATLEQLAEFEGTAKLQLLGLPPKVTAPDLEITKETKEAIFKLTVPADAPAGKHPTLFCQLVVMKDGEPIVHRLGGTELQIDVPLPPKADQPPPMPMPEPMPAAVAEQPPAAKPLTRLEKLRLAAEERKKGGGEPAPPQP